MRKLISLEWDDHAGEGKVKILPEFNKCNEVEKIDALQDWIEVLTDKRQALLNDEDPMTRSILWGEK